MLKKSHQVLLMSLIAPFFFTSVAYAEWNYGIGTGLSWSRTKGEQGFQVPNVGPIKFDVDLDPSDFNDITKTAIGFFGYAANGPWMIQYLYSRTELEDTADSYVPAVSSVASLEINFKVTNAELTVGHLVYKAPSLNILVDGGLRYIKHEFDNTLTLSGAITGQRNQNFDQDWADVIFGLSINVPFADTWTWNNRLNAGFGGSEGTYFVSTGLNWRFHKNWSAILLGKYAAIEYENGSMGDSDWYLYDADESSIGLYVLFNW